MVYDLKYRNCAYILDSDEPVAVSDDWCGLVVHEHQGLKEYQSVLYFLFLLSDS